MKPLLLVLIPALTLSLTSCFSSPDPSSGPTKKQVSHGLIPLTLKNSAPLIKAMSASYKMKDPGTVCGKFKPNETGCFQIKIDPKTKRGKMLVYFGVDKQEVLIADFDQEEVYIQKVSEEILGNDRILQTLVGEGKNKKHHLPKDQDAVSITYVETSAQIFFWDGQKFNTVWIGD